MSYTEPFHCVIWKNHEDWEKYFKSKMKKIKERKKEFARMSQCKKCKKEIKINSFIPYCSRECQINKINGFIGFVPTVIIRDDEIKTNEHAHDVAKGMLSKLSFRDFRGSFECPKCKDHVVFWDNTKATCHNCDISYVIGFTLNGKKIQGEY